MIYAFLMGILTVYLVRLCLTIVVENIAPRVFIELAHQTLYLTVVLSVL